MASSTEQAALDYLARGWSVIPVRERAKRPAIPWQAYLDKLVSGKTLHGWFSHSPDYNVVTVTGALSGVIVLDVDPRHGGKQSLEGLEQRHGALPETTRAYGFSLTLPRPRFC